MTSVAPQMAQSQPSRPALAFMDGRDKPGHDEQGEAVG
jgi:hypothetical protein